MSNSMIVCLVLALAVAVVTAIFLPVEARAARADRPFEWHMTVSAPLAFPVRLLGAAILLADGKTTVLLPKSLEANGWGELGAVSLIGSDRKALPVRLDVQWFSYVERKTWGGSFVLDRSQVMAPLEKSFTAPGSGATGSYEHLVIGLAPQGGVSLWWSGGGVTQEVAHYTATETQFDFLELVGSYKSVEAYATDVIARSLTPGQVRMDGVAPADMAKWSGEYRRKYKTRWSVVDAPRPRGMFAKFVNGETFFWPQMPVDAAEANLPLPRSLSLRWNAADGSPRSAEMQADEKALSGAVQRLAGMGGEAGLRYEINLAERVVRVFVGDERGGTVVMTADR